MYKKGKRTIKKLSTADYRFTLLLDEVLKYQDVGVYESDRTTKRQMKMYAKGLSQLDGINQISKHQITKEQPKAKAIDCFPYEKGHNSFDKSDKSELMFFRMNWHFYRASIKLDIPIRLGVGFSFRDMPHIELVD